MLKRLIIDHNCSFSTSVIRSSNIGKQPIRLESGVQCFTKKVPLEFCKSFTKRKDTVLLDQQVVVIGPKATLKLQLPSFVRIVNQDNQIRVSVDDPTNKLQRAMWGTSRGLINNNVIGVSEGHLAIVRFVGTGYRALLETDANNKTIVTLKVGYPYTPQLKVPPGLLVTSPNPTRLLIEGLDKQQVKLFAARIREFKKPERYKGKGIFVDNETIKLKEKKIK